MSTTIKTTPEFRATRTKRKRLKVYNFCEGWEIKGCWRRIDPMSIFFCYPMDGEPFIIKGGLQTCNEKFKELCREPCVVFRALFHHGVSREIADVKNLPKGVSVCLHRGSRHKDLNSRSEMIIYVGDGGYEVFVKKSFRRIPRCFPIEIREAIKSLENRNNVSPK